MPQRHIRIAFKRVSNGISLRWHDSNQVPGLGRLVYGASNRDLEHIFDEEGCDCSHIVFEHSGWQPKVTSGVLREDCLAVLDDYFRPLVEQKS